MVLEATSNAWLFYDQLGVSISKREKCTLSKTRGRADLLIWLHKRIEEKSFESWKVFPLARSSLVSVLSRMLVWPYSHVCGAKLMFYLIGASTVIVAGVWGGFSSWRRRLGLAHLLSLGVLLWGLALVAGVVLPRMGYASHPAIWFCPEPK